jgi:hypothetical protein
MTSSKERCTFGKGKHYFMTVLFKTKSVSYAYRRRGRLREGGSNLLQTFRAILLSRDECIGDRPALPHPCRATAIPAQQQWRRC